MIESLLEGKEVKLKFEVVEVWVYGNYGLEFIRERGEDGVFGGIGNMV